MLNPTMLFIDLRGAAAACALATALGAAAQPAPSQPVTDTLHGVAVPDPFRNLENVQAPATRDWLQSQGARAAAQLSRIEGRDAMVRRITELSRHAGDAVRSIERMPGERVFYLERKAGQSQFKLMLREGADGAARVLVDPQLTAAATGVPHAINYFVPSWDGKTLAYGMSAGGSEDASLHLLDIASGKALGAPIPRVQQDLLHWTPDSRHLSFNQLRELRQGDPATETYLDSTVFLLDRERPAEAPRALFGPLVNASLQLERLDVAEVIFAPGSRWMLARTTDTTLPEGKLFVAPVSALKGGPIAWRRLATAADKITHLALKGDTLYFHTHVGAPRGKVLALPLAQRVPLARASVLVPEPQRGVLETFSLGRDTLYVQVRAGFNTRVVRHSLGPRAQTGPGRDAAPGVAGSTFMVRDAAAAQRDPWVSTSSWTSPSRVLAVAADGTTRDTGLRRNALPPGAPELEVREVMVPSHDGVQVPLAVVHRKGLVRDGNNPTLLIGYGAYGSSFNAGIDMRDIAWFERGGVIAYANVRGSGAFGHDWYQAGFKATKSNTWKDGVACARWLIAQRYASPATLGIQGTSAGGIFAGRVVTSAPDLFAAAVFDVGVMDAVRAEESANGITNTSEFGSAKNPAEFKALLDMSTYHQIREGQAYPGVLLIHGMNDPRVDVWHSAKAAARLQQANPGGRPVLLRLDSQAGHGMGSTAEQGATRRADIYSFLMWQFGKAPASSE
jgi:prolyl oligopeptidase